MKSERHSGSSEIEYARYKHAAPAFRAALLWIERILHIDVPSDKSLRSFLASGEILCSLVNTLVPGAVKRINHCPNRASAMDNLSLFISACQEKCGIPRSKLFSIDDFADILDRGFECQSNEEIGVKQSEKVVISLFWLAKFVDHDPRCEDLPKLDYSAFTGLLPKTTIIQSSPSFSTGDQIHSEYGATKTHFPISRNSNPASSVVNKRSAVERLPEAHQFVRPPSAMGNTDSSRVVIPPNSKDNSVAEPLDVEQATVEETQTNNNGTEEDEWQTDLDDWRQRRRKVSRQQATKMMSLEEIQEEEERKRREAIRDRMRRIKTQRSCISNSFIASTDIVRPTPPNSPGMALLTGGGFSLLEDIDEVNFNPVSSVPESTPVTESSLATDQSDNKSVSVIHQNGLESKPPISKPASHSSPMNGFKEHSSVESNQIVPTKQEDSIENTTGSESRASGNDRTPTADYREVQIRLQSKVKTVESRWGMMIRAEGPSETAPFIVERVRIGSTADVCDVMNGDILLELNSTHLSPRSGQPLDAITLQELESLMDQLSFTGRPATLRVLRKPNQIEELSDTEQGKETPIASNSAGSVTTDTSDIDDRTEFKPTKAVSVVRIQSQSAPKSNHVPSHPEVPVLHAPPSYSDQPGSLKSQQQLHDVSYPNSSDLTETTDSGPLKAPLRSPTHIPLKKSLSAQSKWG
ncbi:hypothetical protein P879_02205 [Paragonimus westermani]|uniref:Calponin-homology (CH) domain-containing protein n=1 Tax=Paragonimus westermani TaxID=34504 RepID=A0A8T0DY09_9TREM|nr:hypothetical protein P879_02205 [Paragonimus westermani]